MRLNTKYEKHKKKLTKTTPSQKELKEERKAFPLKSNYKSMSEFKLDNVELSLSKLSYGIIESTDVDILVLNEGSIQISKSWIEIIIIMVDNLLEDHPNDFNTLIEKYGVATRKFGISKQYGKYSFELGENYRAFKVFNRDYYVEAILDSETIFNVICGLSKCLGITSNDIKFHLRNKKYRDLDVNFNMVEEAEEIVTIDRLQEMLRKGIYMVAIECLGETTRVKDINLALLAYCNVIYDKYGEDSLLHLENNGSTYIDKYVEKEEQNEQEELDIISSRIRNSNIAIFTDENIIGIINFIQISMYLLGIENEQLRFKFKLLKPKEEQKEWEID